MSHGSATKPDGGSADGDGAPGRPATGGVLRVAPWAELSPDEVYAILRLRVDVFVVEQHCPYPELDGRDREPRTLHVWQPEPGQEAGGERDGGAGDGASGNGAAVDVAVAGYLRILADPDDESVRWMGRVAVAGGHRGSGLASRLLDHALALVPGHSVRIHAQSHLEGWYSRWGFVRSGEDFLEDGIPHLPMTRKAT